MEASIDEITLKSIWLQGRTFAYGEEICFYVFFYVFEKIELFLITIDPDKDPRKYGTLPLLPTYNIKSMFPLNS